MKSFSSVDDYIEGHAGWCSALLKLRKILLGTELKETIKWGAPCYTLDGKNVVGIAAFTNYVGLWFHQGVFLADPDEVLQNAQEGKTKGLRQWRFGNAKEIKVRQVQAYIAEAIENQRQGKVIGVARPKTVTVPPELKGALAKKKKSSNAFAGLTPGRQREYAEYIQSAKQEKTKLSRLEKILPMIEAGLGLNDKYRNC